jgi:radical SAM superfamily enzyme YgiQ (UPF0313 family)
LLTLAGMTPGEHEIEYWEVDDLPPEDELSDNFDLVAISSFTARILDAYTLADQFRQRGTTVVLGGLHVTVLPDEAVEHADSVVIGEGEAVWNEILDDTAAGNLQPRYSSFDRPNFDLANAPMPAFELLDISKYNRLTVQTTRGCPLKCEFCAASILLTPHYKQKPAGQVLAEIDRICEIWPRPFIEFADDNSFINRRYWKELLPELKKRRVKWFTETDLSVHEDEELLRLMRGSGCAQVLIGLESPVEAGLSGIELKNDRKMKWWPDYLDAIKRIQSHGIRVNGCFVLGLDGHTPEIFDQVYDFVKESELYDVQITYQTPFPGTPLYDRLLKDDRLLHPGEWDRCTLFDLNFQPSHMTVDELRNGFLDLMRRLYSDELTKWRRDNFKQKYLRSRKHLSAL